ncbi:MAG: YccF domain-containing protein, partial [Chloroflexota bacterium]
MSFLGNLIWLIFGGFVAGFFYVLGGLLLCLTIIGIPFGRQAIRFGWSTMVPFGKEVVPQPGGESFLSTVFNVVWVIFFGWEIALTHLTSGLILAITIIGLPFARKHFQLIPVSLFPF